MRYSGRACIGFYSLCVNKVHYDIHNSLLPTLSRARSIQSTPTHPICLRFISLLSSHLQLGLPSDLFPSGSPTKTPLRATCPNPLIPLDLFILLVFGEQYKSQSSS
jgi:hypothetical protein